MAQIRVIGGDADGNLKRADAAIRAAAAQGCQAVVLPECLDLGWTHPSARAAATAIPGPRTAALARAAAEAGVYVAAGLVESAGDRLYNAAVLLDDSGRMVLHHRKINELTIAHDLYALGRSLAVAETPFGAVGLAICADLFPSSLALGHALCRMGARLILSPCAWAVEADHDQMRQPYGAIWREAYGELARLYDVAVVGVSGVGSLDAGPWQGRQCIGCSLAVGPAGLLAQGPYGECAEAVLVVRVPLLATPAAGTAIAPLLRARGYAGP